MEQQRLRLVQGTHPRQEKRSAERRPLSVPGQIVWKDARGTTRLASVVTKDVSEHGVRVECLGGVPIPLYRLVYFQLDRGLRERGDRNRAALLDDGKGAQALRRHAVRQLERPEAARQSGELLVEKGSDFRARVRLRRNCIGDQTGYLFVVIRQNDETPRNCRGSQDICCPFGIAFPLTLIKRKREAERYKTFGK